MDLKERRTKYGIYCVRCVTKTPELRPKNLAPGETCSRDGYADPRPENWKPLRGSRSD